MGPMANRPRPIPDESRLKTVARSRAWLLLTRFNELFVALYNDNADRPLIAARWISSDFLFTLDKVRSRTPLHSHREVAGCFTAPPVRRQKSVRIDPFFRMVRLSPPFSRFSSVLAMFGVQWQRRGLRGRVSRPSADLRRITWSLGALRDRRLGSTQIRPIHPSYPSTSHRENRSRQI
jgi:hypothetical protein